MLTTYTPVQSLIEAAQRAVAGEQGAMAGLREALADIEAARADTRQHVAAIAEARDLYEDDTCDIEIDEDPLVDESEDDGLWISAWVWVSTTPDEALDDELDEECDDEDDGEDDGDDDETHDPRPHGHR